MRRHALFARVFATAVFTVAACSPERPTGTDVDVPAGVNTVLSDATSGGDAKFYWLPPIAPARTYPGTFDANLSPELRLCRLTSPTTCGTLIATYTRTSNPAIAVSASAQSYSVEWSTKPASITNGDYRAEVRVAGRLLGVADARVVGSAKDLKNVPAGFVGVQKSKSLTFAFRIETGIIGSLQLAPRGQLVEAGATLQFTVTVRDIHGNTIPGAPVAWTINKPSAATISSTGLLRAIHEDTVLVRAASGVFYDTVTVPIVRPRVDEVVVNPQPLEVYVGQVDTAWATLFSATDSILTGRLVSWSSSNTGVATVSSSGHVRGVSAGTATISATSEGKVGSTTAIVTVPPPAPVARIDVSPDHLMLTANQPIPVTATTYDAANNVLTGRTVEWSAWDTAVVQVAPNGTATTTGPGIAYLWATSEGKTDSARVEVTGDSVTCLRPWALPEIWFLSNPYGRAIRAHHGASPLFGQLGQGTISGYYFPVTLDAPGASGYIGNIITCSVNPITLGARTPLAAGNQLWPTIDGLDSLFSLDPGATWDSTANGGLGGIVGSNQADPMMSPRVVKVGLYAERDHGPGESYVRFRKTAYVFVETYSHTTLSDNSEIRGDIVFRFLRFGP